jgi:hypothetical protein
MEGKSLSVSLSERKVGIAPASPAGERAATLDKRARASWREVLPIHPAAELFPCMSPDELRALGEDIIKNGLTSQIVLWSDGKSPTRLLDGRNRLDAIELATSSPAMVGPPSVMAGKDFLACNKVIVLDKSVDPVVYVISANIHRRHLSAEQKRDLIAKLIKAQPEKSDRQIADTVKVDHKTVGAVRAEQEARGEIPHVETRTDSKGRKQPARKSKPQSKVKPRAERTPLMGGNKVRDDIGADSAGEIARKDTEIEELRSAKRKLEIEAVGLRSEIEEARTPRKPKPAPNGETTLYCSFCGKDQHQVSHLITNGGYRPVCICNECVDLCGDVIKQQKAAAASKMKKPDAEVAPPPPGDGLDIPDFLDRSRHD